MVPRRNQEKTSLLTFFIPWIFFISIPGLNFHFFVNNIFLKFEKLIFFSPDFQKNSNFCDSQTVDKTENAKNNEIKFLVLPLDSPKSQKTVSSENGGHKYLRKCETQASFRCFYRRKNVLIQADIRTARKFEFGQRAWVLSC